MRHRPQRKNYPTGIYGDIDYLERLERYCTYLENNSYKKNDLVEFADWMEYNLKHKLPEQCVQEFIKSKSK